MIFQQVDIFRLILLFTFQGAVSFFFYYLGIKLLKRNLNKMSLILSSFYIVTGSGLLISVIYLPFKELFIGFIIYFIAAFLIPFGAIFLVIFIINLLYFDSKFSIKLQIAYMFIYGILLFLILNIPEGIKISQETQWNPLYSWVFIIVFYLFFASLIIIPTIYFLLKLYNKFEDNELKRKLRYFIIGIIGMFITFYGLILYNSSIHPIFKMIWIGLSIIVIPSGYLIYYGIGRGL